MSELDFYNELYSALNTYLTTTSIYSPSVKKRQPFEMNAFPLVVVSMPEFVFKEETLDKTERKQTLTFEIDIYTQNIDRIGGKVSDMTVALELQKLVLDIIDTRYGMRVVTNRNIPNIDLNVYRVFIRATCEFDIDSEVIFRQ